MFETRIEKNASPAVIRQQKISFFQKLESDSTRKEAQDMFSNYIREKIREDSFVSRIMSAQDVTYDELIPETEPQNEGFYKLVYKEPGGSAQSWNEQSRPDSEYVYGEKVKVRMGGIQTNKFEKSEEEILTYQNMPLMKIVEQNSLKELAAMQDRIFMNMARNAVKSNGNDVSSGGGGISKSLIIDLINAPLQKHLKSAFLLMTETTYNNYFKQGIEVFGDNLVEEQFKNGFGYKSLYGTPVITTIKNSIVNDNEIFSFPAQEFLGVLYTLEDTKFVVEKKDEIVSWYAKKKFGMSIINNNGVARMKLNGYTD